MRFWMILILLAVAAVIGFYVYGQMLEPEQRVIEVEAIDADS